MKKKRTRAGKREKMLRPTSKEQAKVLCKGCLHNHLNTPFASSNICPQLELAKVAKFPPTGDFFMQCNTKDFELLNYPRQAIRKRARELLQCVFRGSWPKLLEAQQYKPPGCKDYFQPDGLYIVIPRDMSPKSEAYFLEQVFAVIRFLNTKSKETGLKKHIGLASQL